MKKALYKLWSVFLTQFGNIRLSKYFPWAYYDTVEYKVTGKQIEDIIDILEPGDCILRGYSSYLDGKFIDDPLEFSHGAIYIGNNIIVHAVAEGVSKIHVIDFCQCDRIAIFRPKKKSHISKAMKYTKFYEVNNTQYDFGFTYGDNAIYCFELCALCYPRLSLKRISIKKFGFIKKNVYLAQSFFESPDFECIYQYNPKFNINYKKQ